MASNRTPTVPSSPDPLADDNAPTVSTRPTPTRGPRGRHLFSSPTKTITSQSTTTVSPWRIRVVFEAEHEDDLPLGSPSRAGPIRTRTKTTKVPVKGLESSPAIVSTPKKRARSVSRPRQTPAAAAEVEEEEEEGEETETPKKKKAPATRKKTPAAKPRSRKKKDDETAEKEVPPATLQKPTTVRKTRTATRAGSTPAATLASTRTRRQTPRSNSAVPDDTENQGASAPVDSTRSRSALGKKDSNSLSENNSNTQLISPNPTRRRSSSRSPSPPKRMRHEKSTTESYSIHEGDTLSLPDFMSSPTAPASLNGDQSDQSEEDALADVSHGWQPPAPNTDPQEHDFTYMSNGTSFTPRRPGKSGLANEVLLSSSPPPVGVDTFYGASSHLREQAQLDAQKEQDEEMDDGVSMLPDDLTGGISDYHGYTGPVSESPAKPLRPTEYTHMDNGQSYTPHTLNKGAMDLDDDYDGISDAESVSPDTFYGAEEHTQQDIKGKGRAIDSSHGVVTPEESPELSSPRNASLVPEPSLPIIITPSFTYTQTPNANPAPRSQPIPRNTPNIGRVVEASSVMSDVLAVDPMNMEQERFGTTPAPPTPESRGRTPPRVPSPRVVIPVSTKKRPKYTKYTKKQEPSIDDSYAAERRAVAQRARDVGAITIHDSSLISTDESSFSTAYPGSFEDTVAYEQSMLNLQQQAELRPAPSASVDGPPLIIRPDPPNPLQWAKEQYAHLAAILKSNSTPPTKKRFLLQLHERDYALFGGVEVVRELDVDKQGWLRLTARESAAVVRFRDRESKRGREWGVGEVVRRVAGLKVASVKREVTGAKREVVGAKRDVVGARM